MDPERPTLPPDPGLPAVLEDRAGDEVGPYRLISQLGEGTFGIVWLAERRHPMVQRVALKILRLGMNSREVVIRFEQERNALAVMSHPNVAKVFDGGVTPNGRPYFAMELVKGETITAYCDRNRLNLTERLELFIDVCEAVQHAHFKGIIHRDLKPSNILVAPSDSVSQVPTANRPRGVVKVIDFGVAKAIGPGWSLGKHATEIGQPMGTPEFMSPEQAEAGPTDVDSRTDVYSLGVVLYLLLCGALPFESSMLVGANRSERAKAIRELEPPRPSARLSSLGEKQSSGIAASRNMDFGRLRTDLGRELDLIPLMAMRKDRTQRYSTPSELADDIRRYLRHEPIRAAPESSLYLLSKWLKRHSRVAIACGLGASIPLFVAAEVLAASPAGSRTLQWFLALLAAIAILPLLAAFMVWRIGARGGGRVDGRSAFRFVAGQGMRSFAAFFLMALALALSDALEVERRLGWSRVGIGIGIIAGACLILYAMQIRDMRRTLRVSWTAAFTAAWLQGLLFSILIAAILALSILLALSFRAWGGRADAPAAPTAGDSLDYLIQRPATVGLAGAVLAGDFQRAAGFGVSMTDIVLARSLPPSVLDARSLHGMAAAILSEERAWPRYVNRAVLWAESACLLDGRRDPVMLRTCAALHWRLRSSNPQFDHHRDQAIEFQSEAMKRAEESLGKDGSNPYGLTESDIATMRSELATYRRSNSR